MKNLVFIFQLMEYFPSFFNSFFFFFFCGFQIIFFIIQDSKKNYINSNLKIKQKLQPIYQEKLLTYYLMIINIFFF